MMAQAAVRSKAAILLLFIYCLFIAFFFFGAGSLLCGVFVFGTMIAIGVYITTMVSAHQYESLKTKVKVKNT